MQPMWSGFVQNISQGVHQGKAKILILPIIDLNPSGYSCIYSTLLFVQDQTLQLDIKTPCLTFDQPLWQKAQEIVVAKSLDFTILLGGFHTLMSFVGSIGHFMQGSGLSEALGTIYGESTVNKMLSGKSIVRALRGLFLTEKALTIEIQELLLSDNVIDQEGIDCIQNEISKLRNGDITIEYIDPNKITKITTVFENRMMELSNISRTAKLWINFMNYVHTIRMFIAASRTGNWNLTLVTMESMINLFAATGHTNYARCLRRHLQLMLKLKDSHPQVHEKFAQQGAHVTRRSERYWTGLWPDLIIEQVLMKSLKSCGGLTHRRGLTESVRPLWINSQHLSSLIYSAMTSLTSNQTVSSHQHEKLGVTRQKRDAKDLDKISSWFKIHNLVDSNRTRLQSLSTGLIAEYKINYDET